MTSRWHDLSQMIFVSFSQSPPSSFLSFPSSSDGSDLNCHSYPSLKRRHNDQVEFVLWPYQGLALESAVSQRWVLVSGWQQPSGTKEENIVGSWNWVWYQSVMLVSLDTLKAGIIMWACLTTWTLVSGDAQVLLSGLGEVALAACKPFLEDGSSVSAFISREKLGRVLGGIEKSWDLCPVHLDPSSPPSCQMNFWASAHL